MSHCFSPVAVHEETGEQATELCRHLENLRLLHGRLPGLLSHKERLGQGRQTHLFRDPNSHESKSLQLMSFPGCEKAKSAGNAHHPWKKQDSDHAQSVVTFSRVHRHATEACYFEFQPPTSSTPTHPRMEELRPRVVTSRKDGNDVKHRRQHRPRGAKSSVFSTSLATRSTSIVFSGCTD